MPGIRVVALLLVLPGAQPVVAQVIEAPPRAASGILGGDNPSNPDAARQQISLTVNMLGGYSDNIALEAQGATAGFAFAPRRSGSTGTGTATLNYSRVQRASSLDAYGRAFVNSFSAIDSGLATGGEGSVRARQRLFGRTLVSGTGQAQSRPTFGFATFGSAPPEILAPPPDPLLGITQIRSISSMVNGSIDQEWTTRQTTSFAVASSRVTFGAQGIDMRATSYDAMHRWAFSRTLGFNLGFRRALTRAQGALGAERPLDTDRATIGLEYTRALSPTRRLRISGGPGALRVRTLSDLNDTPLDYVTPSGFASVALDLGRTWAVAGSWQREAMLIDGLVRQSFVTDSAGLSLGGNVTRNLQFAATGSYASGAPHEGETGAFESLIGSAQLLYTLSRCCQMVGLYSYNQHTLRDVLAVPAGFPNRLERGSVQIGMTVWLPLYGSFPPAGRPTNRR